MRKPSSWTPSFNGSIEVSTDAVGLSSNAGALVVREMLDKLGIIERLDERLTDPRNQELITHPLAEILRTFVLLYALGWSELDDADALRDDPLLRLAVSERKGARALRSEGEQVPDGLASQPTCSRTLRILAADGNRAVLGDALCDVVLRRHQLMKIPRATRRVVDVDSLPLPVHGQQYGSAFNGYYEQRVYHPLSASLGDTGETLAVRLRKGNVGSADGVLDLILPLLDRIEGPDGLCEKAIIRADAAFPSEPFFKALEDRGTSYVSRLKANAVLDALAAPHVWRPPGRPPQTPREWTFDLEYAAEKWTKERRVVLVVLERPGQLFLDSFWLVTDMTAKQMPKEDLLALYRQRGTAEARFGDFMSTMNPSPSATIHFRKTKNGKPPKRPTPVSNPMHVNEVIFLLNLVSANVMHAVRLFLESGPRPGPRRDAHDGSASEQNMNQPAKDAPAPTASTSIGTLHRTLARVLRLAARVTVHARKVTVHVDALARELWGDFVERLSRLRALPA